MSKSEDPLDESMTVVKTASCDTLTKKSKLTYQIGTLPDGEVYFRILENSGNGFFSNEWVALADIRKVLSKVPVGKPVTAIMLNDLFTGKSVNTPGSSWRCSSRRSCWCPCRGRSGVTSRSIRERLRSGWNDLDLARASRRVPPGRKPQGHPQLPRRRPS